MRRGALLIALVGALSTSTGLAVASSSGFKTGNYQGKKADGNVVVNVSFSAKKRAINGFGASATLARGAAHCTPGIVGQARIGATDAKAIVIRKGAFSATYSLPGGAATVKVSGKLAGSKASGTVSITAHLSGTGAPVPPPGLQTCKSGKVKWSAAKV